MKLTYNGVKKRCKNCYEHHKVRRTGDETNKTIYSWEKKTYDKYVEVFKENNPHIMKSIMEHRNDVATSESDETTNDCTHEENILDVDDDNFDYTFTYDINLS